jgi:hypothetical protein
MRIRTHPKLRSMHVGDEVYSMREHIYACVTAIFPAAVCVQTIALSWQHGATLRATPQLWCAEDIENLSVCRSCGLRDDLTCEYLTGAPFRLCRSCRHPRGGCAG